ncbi:chromosome segregation protein SMC, partial [Candidatus Sumerlaeota bacterium]|nr:chromosome segregation protein SMC [Candidatus Sumerlaeota bacterium]
MFFKRLEIVGFKSFATKTALEFLPGITVIVGPNGCGKSNIFDAVRWALGEQRARVLRGHRMGDVIFAGSSSHKALSMASVTLLINNEDRRLPIDFSEVQICRRLFKVGDDEHESEYLLNRTSCRLREISDLFLGTGIGTDSYSIMEQGQVDFIINARPNERRYLFDEAVGISKYRARREEALRKLERTEADLVRLNDVLSELKTRLRSLKIQANRAERYKQMMAELRQMECNLLLLAYRELLAEKSNVDAQYDSMNTALQATVARMALLEQQLLDKQVEMDGLERERQAVGSRRAQAEKELDGLQAQQALLRERIETTNAQMRRDEIQIETLRRDRATLADRRDRAGADVGELTLQLSRLEADHNAQREQLDQLVQSQSDAIERIAQLREKTRRAIEEETHNESERRIASAMKAQADENLAQANAKLEQTKAGLSALDADLSRFQADSVQKHQALEQLDKEIERLDVLQREQSSHLHALEQEKSSTIRARHEAESRRQALQALQENLEGFVAGVREIVAASRRGQVAGVIGAIASLLRPSAEDELAIEAALAMHVQDVVVESEATALAAIDFLRRGQIGRATFLPLDRMAGARREPALETLVACPGVVGIAADLVESDATVRPVVEGLLGQTVVVESLDAARRLRADNPRGRFVTRDGTVLDADGSVAGGHVRSSGLLGREREIRELTERIACHDQNVADLDTRIAEQVAAMEATAGEREIVAGRAGAI